MLHHTAQFHFNLPGQHFVHFFGAELHMRGSVATSEAYSYFLHSDLFINCMGLLSILSVVTMDAWKPPPISIGLFLLLLPCLYGQVGPIQIGLCMGRCACMLISEYEASGLYLYKSVVHMLTSARQNGICRCLHSKKL